MNTAKVMEDGEIRLPPQVAAELNMKPGDSVGVEVEADGTVRLHPKALKIEDVCGMLQPPKGVHLSNEQMDEAVSEAFRRSGL